MVPAVTGSYYRVFDSNTFRQKTCELPIPTSKALPVYPNSWGAAQTTDVLVIVA